MRISDWSSDVCSSDLLAVYIGLVYAYLPFFILPLYATLVKLDLRLLEAAYDLGARPWRAFLHVTLPLSMPGVVAGAMLVFIPSVGRSEEHTSELQSLMRISYAVFCLQKKNTTDNKEYRN